MRATSLHPEAALAAALPGAVQARNRNATGIDTNQYWTPLMRQNPGHQGVMRRGVFGCWSGAATVVFEGAAKEMTEGELNLLRWQCRRGMLELDLVLERFLQKYGNRLEGEKLDAFRTLLTYADNDLLDLIRGRGECHDARLAEVVRCLRG